MEDFGRGLGILLYGGCAVIVFLAFVVAVLAGLIIAGVL